MSLRKSQRRGRQRCRKLWAQIGNVLYLQSRTEAHSCILLSVLEMTDCAQEKKWLLQTSVFPSEKQRQEWSNRRVNKNREGWDFIGSLWALGINGPRLDHFRAQNYERSEPAERRNEENTAMFRRSKWQNFSILVSVYWRQLRGNRRESSDKTRGTTQNHKTTSQETAFWSKRRTKNLKNEI